MTRFHLGFIEKLLEFRLHILSDLSIILSDLSIIVSGDMNCRAGNEQPDFIEDDKIIEFNQFLTDFDPDINIPLRYSMDTIITSRGKHLNEMCIQTGLKWKNYQ
jgi:hypothetical protein